MTTINVPTMEGIWRKPTTNYVPPVYSPEEVAQLVEFAEAMILGCEKTEPGRLFLCAESFETGGLPRACAAGAAGYHLGLVHARSEDSDEGYWALRERFPILNSIIALPDTLDGKKPWSPYPTGEEYYYDMLRTAAQLNDSGLMTREQIAGWLLSLARDNKENRVEATPSDELVSEFVSAMTPAEAVIEI